MPQFQKSYNHTRDEISLACMLALTLVTQLPEKVHENNYGGYLSLLPVGTVLQWTERIGYISVDKADNIYRNKAMKYRILSAEKATRLDSDPCKIADHVSSFQSRKPEEQQYAGAVRFPNNMILSFSGLPELSDEAVVLLTGMLLGWLTRKEAKAIARLSKNVTFTDLLTEATERGLI